MHILWSKVIDNRAQIVYYNGRVSTKGARKTKRKAHEI
nr:MAG TPA: hypothetical protein [Caudoviricetes sp.]